MCPAVCVPAVTGWGLPDSGDPVSNLCLHFASFSFFVSPFPSECAAFHSVVLGDTYNIPLDPRGKQQGSAAPSYPSETPWVSFLGDGGIWTDSGPRGEQGRGDMSFFRALPTLSSLQGHFLMLSLSGRHPAHAPPPRLSQHLPPPPSSDTTTLLPVQRSPVWEKRERLWGAHSGINGPGNR